MPVPVAIERCSDYDKNKVEEALNKCLNALGGIEGYVRPGQRVFIKINLLMRKRPEEAVTTHPAVVEAVVRAIQKAGGIPVIGDSPGGMFNERTLRGIYRTCGIEQVAENTGAELNYDVSETEIPSPDGKILKRLSIVKAIADADVIIDIGKLKTHGMAVFTGAVKNMFGVVPGMRKAEYHLKMPDLNDFADMLIDINMAVKPALAIIDGIVGMDGNGPSAGRPRSIGVIVASASTFAADVAAVSIAGIPLDVIPTVRQAKKRGLPATLDDIKVLGTSVNDVKVKDFEMPPRRGVSFLDGKVPRFMVGFLRNMTMARPVFDYDACKGCGDCADNCPPRAIKMVDKRPRVDLNICIRCFCCQELCPYKAVDIKKSSTTLD